MTAPLPQSNVLAAIGTAVVCSVVCSWTISTYFHGQVQREFDRIHSRLDGSYSRHEYASPLTVGDAYPAEPELPLPAGEEP